MSTIIFCPNCDALILDAPRCPHCGKWERPPEAPAGRGAVPWRGTLPASLDAGLTLAGDMLFACDAGGRLHALDAATGAPRWPHPAELGNWRIYRRVAVEGGLVLIGPNDRAAIPAADKAVLALDMTTGEERWRQPLGVRGISDPLVCEDSVYVATSDGHAAALALADGTLRWREPLAGVCQAAPAAVETAAGEQLVVYGSDKGVLAALRPADGSMAWSFTAEGGGQWGASFPYTPVFDGGVLYATCWNSHCYALDAVTGELRWAVGPAKRPPMTPPMIGGNVLFFCAHDRYVYCLDRATGAMRWQTQLPRRSQTTPLLIENRLYVASQDHRVYALDPVTGALEDKPILETPRHVEADWASDGERIYLGDCEGHLFALVARAPQEESDPEALASQGQWDDAAPLYALAGELCKAAEFYRDRLGELHHAGQLFERCGERGEAAALYERSGDAKTARRLYRELGDHLRAAALSEQLGEIEAAASDSAAAGEWERAGRLLDGLGEAFWPQAASAYERAALTAQAEGGKAQAGPLLEIAAERYHRIGQPEKAASLYRDAGRDDLVLDIIAETRDALLRGRLEILFMPPEVLGPHYLKQGRYGEAAEVFLHAGLRREAAAAYERGGEFALAAQRYRAAEAPADAARMCERAGDWAQAAELYEQAGQPDRAAPLWARAGDHVRAARSYEAAGAWAAAGSEWGDAAQWEDAARAWERAHDFHRVADAYLKLGRCYDAAERCWQGAQAAQAAAEPAAAIASLYERAMGLFDDCGADERMAECDRMRRYLREQPLLEILLPVAPELVEGGSGKIELGVRNVGWGMARNIVFGVKKGYFEADFTRVGKPFGLERDRETARNIYIVPLRSGREVPLFLEVTYADVHGVPMTPLEPTCDILVRGKEERKGETTPQYIHVQGPWIQAPGAGQVVGGDVSSVEISRRPPASDTPHAAPVPAPAPAETRQITCSHCGEEQPADRFKCAHCSMPFVRCPACGRYQPGHGQFCIHCGAGM